mgnify:CR=1 FL=1
MKKILITGGAGFIGLNISKKLIEMGYKVFALDNFNRAIKDSDLIKLKKNKNFKIITAELKKEIRLNIKFTHIFHLAATVGVNNVNKSRLDSKYFNVNQAEANKVLLSERETIPISITTASEGVADFNITRKEFEEAYIQAEAEEKFNQRMSILDEEYALNDEDREVIASDIKDMDDGGGWG